MSDIQTQWANALAALRVIQEGHEDAIAQREAQAEQYNADTVRHLAQVLRQQEQIADLTHKLYLATRPAADVYVTVDKERGRLTQLKQALAIITNEFSYPKSAAAVTRMAPAVAALYDKVGYHLSGGFGVVDFWDWNPATGPRPAKPANAASLLLMSQLANRFHKPHVFYLYRPSWHLKRDRARAMTYAEAFGPGSNETGRLAGEFKDDWRLMVEEMVFTAAGEVLKGDANATFECVVHNEFKGMWELLLKDKVIKAQNWADGMNPGTPGFGDIDYGPYYALTVEGAMNGFRRLGVGPERVRFGGCYAVIQAEGVRNANALPLTHPLANKPYGYLAKQPINAMERFVQQCIDNNWPLHFLAMDGGTNNKDQVYLTGIWQLMQKVADVTEYMRAFLDSKGLPGVPIYWMERYLTERPDPGAKLITAEQDKMERRAVVTVDGLCRLAWSGADTAFQWGLRGEDGDPVLNKENAAYFRADGTPTLLYAALMLFKECFPVGGHIYPLTFEGEDVGGWGYDGGALLYNKTSTPRVVCLGDKVATLEANGLLALPADSASEG